MRSRLFEDLVVSGNAGAGSPPVRTWPLSVAIHAIAVAALATLSVKAVKEAPLPSGPLVFASSPRPQPSIAPPAVGGASTRPRGGRTLAVPVDPRPPILGDGPPADSETDLLEPPAGNLPLCLGCVPGPSGGGNDAGLDAPGSAGDGAGAPTPVGGAILEPRRIHGGAPPYPELARRAHVEGKVVLECVIDASGRVTGLRVVSGHPLLAAAAEDAVRAWIYTPTTLNGKAISVVLNVTVKFGLGRH